MNISETDDTTKCKNPMKKSASKYGKLARISGSAVTCCLQYELTQYDMKACGGVARRETFGKSYCNFCFQPTTTTKGYS